MVRETVAEWSKTLKRLLDTEFSVKILFGKVKELYCCILADLYGPHLILKHSWYGLSKYLKCRSRFKAALYSIIKVKSFVSVKLLTWDSWVRSMNSVLS